MLPPPLAFPTRVPGAQDALMYEDDRGWTDPEDVDMNDSAESSVHVQRKMARAKRMPVEREEVVRITLQALRDMGYQ
jgi:hypothetical protein